ncbi:MAG: cytochrome c3 family protein [Spirochaetota bacterium]
MKYDFSTLTVKSFLPFVIPFLVFGMLTFVVTWYGCDYMETFHAKKEMPFTHKTHTELYGISCQQCHRFDENGRFLGIPTAGDCRSCHDGSSASEKAFLTGLADDYKPWESYSKQPDLVYFSHIAVAAHAGGESQCTPCHGDKGSTITTDRISGKMKMGQCMDCHDALKISNKCAVCHD